jgi:hypothetical protein
MSMLKRLGNFLLQDGPSSKNVNSNPDPDASEKDQEEEANRIKCTYKNIIFSHRSSKLRRKMNESCGVIQ